jgi:hypothetical protein
LEELMDEEEITDAEDYMASILELLATKPRYKEMSASEGFQMVADTIRSHHEEMVEILLPRSIN